MSHQSGAGSSGHGAAPYAANGEGQPGPWHEQAYTNPGLAHGAPHLPPGMTHQHMYPQHGGHMPYHYAQNYAFPGQSPVGTSHPAMGGYDSRSFGTPYGASPTAMSPAGSADMSFHSPSMDGSSSSPFADTYRMLLPLSGPPQGRPAIAPLNLPRNMSQSHSVKQTVVLNAPGRQRSATLPRDLFGGATSPQDSIHPPAEGPNMKRLLETYQREEAQKLKLLDTPGGEGSGDVLQDDERGHAELYACVNRLQQQAASTHAMNRVHEEVLQHVMKELESYRGREATLRAELDALRQELQNDEASGKSKAKGGPTARNHPQLTAAIHVISRQMLGVDPEDKNAALPHPLKDGEAQRKNQNGDKLWNPVWSAQVNRTGAKEFISALAKRALESARSPENIHRIPDGSRTKKLAEQIATVRRPK